MAVENKSAPIADTQELVLEPMFLSIGDLVLLKQSNPNNHTKRISEKLSGLET